MKLKANTHSSNPLQFVGRHWALEPSFLLLVIFVFFRLAHNRHDRRADQKLPQQLGGAGGVSRCEGVLRSPAARDAAEHGEPLCPGADGRRRPHFPALSIVHSLAAEARVLSAELVAVRFRPCAQIGARLEVLRRV